MGVWWYYYGSLGRDWCCKLEVKSIWILVYYIYVRFFNIVILLEDLNLWFMVKLLLVCFS